MVNEIRSKILYYSEKFYLIMLVILTSYFVLSYVYVDIVWENIGKGVPILQDIVKYFLLEPYLILFVISAVRFACIEKIRWQEVLVGILVCGLSGYAVEQNRYTEILIMILLMAGAKGIPFRKIVKAHFLTVLIIVGAVFLLSQIGVIENLVYTLEGRGTRMAFGFTYPTRFAAHIFYLFLWYWYLRGEKLTYVESVFPMAAGLFVWIFCEARLSAVALLLLGVVMALHIYIYKGNLQKTGEYYMNGWIAQFLSLSVPIASLVITLMTMCYNSGSPLMRMLNSALSGRLSLSKKAMDMYGFEIWGQWIRLAGNGYHLEGNSKYFYIDSSFLQFSIQYGIVMLIMLLLLFWYVGFKAQKKQDWILLWIIGFVALHGMLEPHVLRVAYCPLICYVFVEVSDGRRFKDAKS